MITIYGIKSCNSMKKAFDALGAANLSYDFHDYKKLGVTAAQLQDWISQVGWEKLLNTRGTTWRTLSEADRGGDMNAERATALMIAKPSLIKRPVISGGPSLIVGFDEDQIQALKESK